nr:DUF423 domain-containing protein [Psychromonas sp. SA13A]
MFGAYASHGLALWATPAQVSQVQLAAQYQLFHAIILLLIAVLGSVFALPAGSKRLLTISQYCFTLGTLCFSGSLYYLVFLGSKLLVLITPVGGLLLIFGWLAIIISMIFKQK